MIYIDSSSLLKVLWDEPESAAIRKAVAAEDQVVISSLTELEAEIQLRAKFLSGATSKTRYHAYRRMLSSFHGLLPFQFRGLPGTVFQEAVRQHNAAKAHCRTLERLHLAGMAELGVRRLMTNDGKQATAASALGYEVIIPA
jgi:uncharacterized protein with PIN domain